MPWKKKVLNVWQIRLLKNTPWWSDCQRASEKTILMYGKHVTRCTKYSTGLKTCLETKKIFMCAKEECLKPQPIEVNAR